MTTGATATFNETRDQLITDALMKVGVVGPDATPTGSQYSHGARALNRLVKSLDPEGEYLWRVVRRTITTTSGTAAYTPAADVMTIDEPLNFKRSAGNGRSPVRVISRDDYMLIGDRTTTGAPSVVFVEKTLSSLTLNFWPIPDASSDTIEYAAVLRSLDYSTGANTSDFPQEWQQALVYGLAADLAFDYGQPELAAQLRAVFTEEKVKQRESSTETGNARLVPFGLTWGGDW